MRRKLLAALAAALMAVPVVGTGEASASWFNWFNGVLSAGQRKYEGVAHHTYATEADSTGPSPCTGVTGNYFICNNNGGHDVLVNGYALGDPNGADHDNNAHYYHLWWCSGSC